MTFGLRLTEETLETVEYKIKQSQEIAQKEERYDVLKQLSDATNFIELWKKNKMYRTMKEKEEFVLRIIELWT